MSRRTKCDPEKETSQLMYEARMQYVTGHVDASVSTQDTSIWTIQIPEHLAAAEGHGRGDGRAAAERPGLGPGDARDVVLGAEPSTATARSPEGADESDSDAESDCDDVGPKESLPPCGTGRHDSTEFNDFMRLLDKETGGKKGRKEIRPMTAPAQIKQAQRGYFVPDALGIRV
ncbi:hypothetical protein JL720_16617 [Aureococcus anophagefferens]|nr:hypothetical protein JL720_16617 [Aureococcus anophagefferens]